MVGEIEALRIMTQEIAQHVEHEKHGAEEVKNGGFDGIPEALGIGLEIADGRSINMHACSDTDQLRKCQHGWRYGGIG